MEEVHSQPKKLKGTIMQNGAPGRGAPNSTKGLSYSFMIRSFLILHD